MLRSSHWIAAGLALSLSACAAGMQGDTAGGLAYGDGWDRDDDGFVNPTELAIGFDGAGTFDRWDRDGDDALDQTEFFAGMGDADADFGSWESWDDDRDQKIWVDEFVDGFFRMWDEDGDGLLSAAELRAGMQLM